MEEKTQYGILMNRVLLNANMYIFKPVQIISGIFDNIGGSQLFIDKMGSTYLLSNNVQALSCDDELSVFHIIDEETLLDKYPEDSIIEALDEYYNDITSTVTIGFLNEEFDKLYMLQYDLKNILEMVESGISLDNIPAQKQETEKEKQLMHLMIDGEEQTFDTKDTFFITKETFESILSITDNDVLRQTLQQIYDMSKGSPVDLQVEDSKLDLVIKSGTDLLKIFNQSYDFILKINDIEEMKDVISQLIDLYESLYTDFDLREENDKTAACKDFLFRMIEEYDEIYKLKDLDEIKTRITKIKLSEEVNIRQLAETYEIPAYNFDVVDNVKDNNVVEPLLDLVDMKNYFDRKIIGQEKAKIDVISAIFMNGLSDDKRDRNNCLLIGPTGSGKTLIAETIGEYLGIPLAIYDTTQLTAPGYVGSNIEDCLALLLSATRGNIKEAEKGIVVFDEIDKKGSSSNGDISGRAVLNNLLPFIQGTTYQVKYNNRTVAFDTSNLTIFATGAFTGAVEDKEVSESSMGFAGKLIESKEDIKYPKLTVEDLAKHGNIPIELLGRFTTITQLSGHTKESLRKIILDSESSALLHEKKKLSKIKIELDWTEDFIDEVINRALELKTGARSIKSSLEEAILSVRWHVLCNRKVYNKIVLTGNTVKDNNDCLIYDFEGNCYNLKDLIKQQEIDVEKVKKLEYKG